MDELEGVIFGAITVCDRPWRQGADTGQLYVVEFDSGWVKVGQSTTWTNRRAQIASEYGKRYGWTIVRDWQSPPISGVRHEGAARSELSELEQRLIRIIRRIPGMQVFSDELPNRGRGVSGAGETETFQGRSFGDLVACAEVLAQCSTSGLCCRPDPPMPGGGSAPADP